MQIKHIAGFILAVIGIAVSTAIGAAAGAILSETFRPSTARIYVSLQAQPEQAQGLAWTATEAPEETVAGGEAPKGVSAACTTRHPKNNARRATCAEGELAGLDYLQAFPDRWKFQSDTTEQTLAAMEAGNPGAVMLAKCMRLHGAAKSADGYPHYARMKACLEGEEAARQNAEAN